MEPSPVKETYDRLLKAETQHQVLQGLVDVRKVVDWPHGIANIKRLQTSGLLKKIVYCLQTTRKKEILDISLSILGNCCMDEGCVVDLVHKYNVLSALNQVVKKYPKADSLNGRVFRTLGNICQHKDYEWASLIQQKKPQLIIHTIEFLKNIVTDETFVISEATTVMGIRCLRQLLERGTIKSMAKVLSTVGLLLIKYGKLWEEKQEGEKILLNIIKILFEFSKYDHYPWMEELRTTEKGNSIVYLAKILMINPKLVVKIVMNFLRICRYKSDLPITELFDNFIGIIKDKPDFDEIRQDCIKCVCRLLQHPGNRINDRCGESIPILINVLNQLTLDSNSQIDCCVIIVSTLRECQYNEALIEEQINNDVITVLMKKLTTILEPFSFVHKSDRIIKGNGSLFKKAKRFKFDKSSDDSLSSFDESSDDEEMAFFRMREFSPTESVSAMSNISGISPFSSPRSHFGGMSEDGSDDDYSPVCSDVETNDFSSHEADFFEDPDIPPDPLDNSDNEQNQNINEIYPSENNLKLILEIVALLKVFLNLVPPPLNLGHPELLYYLLKGGIVLPYKDSRKFKDLIFKIIERYNFLLPLMKTNFIPSIYELLKFQHGVTCTKCCTLNYVFKVLTKVAESGIGKGDIAHKLLRGDSTTKQKFSLIIPYIIRNRVILGKLLLNCGALEILLKLLQESGENQEKSIVALSVLAMKLKIPNPKCGEKHKTETRPEARVTNDVYFAMDDGSLIAGNRVVLSKSSEYFNTLLNGAFKESTQTVIKLPNVASQTFRSLLDLMRHDEDIARGHSSTCDIEVDIHTFLDILTISDRFLLQAYCDYITRCIKEFRISPETVPVIYSYGLESRTNFLRDECIAYALVSNVSDSEKFLMFRSLLDLGFNVEIIEDIKKILLKYMA